MTKPRAGADLSWFEQALVLLSLALLGVSLFLGVMLLR